MFKSSNSRLCISNKERLLFAKRLSSYLGAGIPIVESLDLIHSMPTSSNHKRLLKQIIEDVQTGYPLSFALARFPRVYRASHIQIIAVGEATGTLATSLFTLARMIGTNLDRKRAILAALTYPIILLTGSIAISALLVLYIFPKIVPTLRGLHTELPFTTRALIGLSTFIQFHWLATLLAAFAVSCSAFLLLRMPITKTRIDALLLRLPLGGTLIRFSTIASIFHTVSLLLSSGARLDEALQMAQSGIANGTYRLALARARTAVLSGSKLSTALGEEPFLFPSVCLQLISVGEMTGTLSESAASIAHIQEQELSDGLHFLASVLEPSIMIVMGLGIGFIALAIISPMYGITQALSL